MGTFSAAVDRVVDAHVHLGSLDRVEVLEQIRAELGFERMTILATPSREHVNTNHLAFLAKARRPKRFGVFAGLDHSALWSAGKIATPSPAEQVDRLADLGADGIKMLESLPYIHKFIPQPLDGPYYQAYFARVAARELTLLWHVANPETFWVSGAIPDWARKLDWFHDETVLGKDALHAQAEAVLARHPQLKVIFAHFYFHSRLLDRAAELFEAYPNVCFDLAPGVEMMQNLSEDPAGAREFFGRFADRIVFGTDIMNWQTPHEAVVRAHLIRRWLETDEIFEIPADADSYLGHGEGGKVVGMSLPADVLAKIYAGNYERLTAPEPRPLDVGAAVEECRRVVEIVAVNTGAPVGETEPARVAELLAAGG